MSWPVLSASLLLMSCSGDGKSDGVCVDPSTWYEDADGDGFGRESRFLLSCERPAPAYIRELGDCNDHNADAYPGAEEIPYDGVDQDCDGEDPTDLDGDGFLAQEAGGDDCDDDRSDVYPGAEEIPNDGLDQDCDGDDLMDADGDGFLAEEAGGDDCDDERSDVYPGAPEVCGDGAVNDCDGDGFDAEACVLDGEYGLGDVAHAVLGVDAGDWAGRAVGAAGDVDGDGYDDLLVGAYSEGDDLPTVAPPSVHELAAGTRGAAYLLRGGPDGITVSSLEDADAVLMGAEDAHYAGRAVAGAGDVDGDGYADVLVGAFGDDEGGVLAGATFLFYGSPSGLVTGPVTDAGVKLIGETLNSESGYATSGAGDLNGDGYDDVVIGAPHEDTLGTDAGRTYIFLGSADRIGPSSLADADTILSGAEEDDHVGEWADAAGDVDGDGFGDLVIGAYKESSVGEWCGAAYLALGSAGGVPSGSADDLHGKYAGESDNDRAGVSVSGLGDMNGDGYDDFIVGAYEEDTVGRDSGAAYILLGSSAGVPSRNLSEADGRLLGEGPGNQAGYSVSGAGDVDGDGFGDAFVGARNESSGGHLAGAAYLILGSVDGPVSGSLADASVKFVGGASNDHTAEAVAGAGDLNGDGYDDIVVGAPNVSDPAVQQGAVYIIPGFGP